MANVSGMTKEETTIIKGKPVTLVRRVSNMLKDGNYSGPPLLFRHASMQKLRHCCQNLNLFPYLLYSYDNSKSHPIARRVNGELIRSFFRRLLYFYKLTRYTTLYNDNNKNKDSNDIVKKISIESKKDEAEELGVIDNEPRSITKFECYPRQKQNQISIFLKVAIYFIPLILILQMVLIYHNGCILLEILLEKNIPFFIFLLITLMVMAGIGLMIFFHESKTKKCPRNNVIYNKNNRIIKKKKIQ